MKLNMRGTLLGLAMGLFAMSGVAFGAEVVKIGIFDFQRIVDDSAAGKRYSEEFKGQGQKMQRVLKEKESEVEELEKSIDRKALAISQEARDDKELELQTRTEELKSLTKRYQGVLQGLNFKLTDQINKDIFKLIEDIGKRDGYTLILERRAGGVVYFPAAIDVTDQLLKAYDDLEAKRVKEGKTEPEKKTEKKP